MKKHMPLLSVIVPVYNCEQYLWECVESIRAQTYSNLEIILIDDGSTDRSGDICDELGRLDERVKVIHQSNLGQQGATTRGLECATGEYIGFVDADDYIDKQMYMELYCLMGDADLAASGTIRVDKNGQVTDEWNDLLPEGSYSDTDDCLYDNLLISSSFDGGPVIGGISNNKWSKLYKHELVNKIYKTVNVSVAIAEDLLFVLAYILQCKKIYVSHKKFYYYRQTDTSVLHRPNPDFLSEENRLYKCGMDLIAGHRKEKELSDQFQRRFLNRLYSQTPTYMGISRSVMPPIYYFSDEHMLCGKRVVIYGAGTVGADYVKRWKKNDSIKIVAVVDKKKVPSSVYGIDVIHPVRLQDLQYDHIICAAAQKNMANSMITQLKKLEIPEEKIVWKKPVNIWQEYFLRR